MKAPLDQIELRLQALIEGSMTFLLPWGNPQHMLAHQLVESMRSNCLTATDGSIIAPNYYVILVHSSRLNYWTSNQAFLDEIARVLFQAGTEAGLHFDAPPAIHLVANDDLLPNGIHITASVSVETFAQTSVLESSQASVDELPENNLPVNAFLIVNGVQVFPLKQAVVNIGRRADNHLVIDDPRVSRAHAQLRAVKGSYLLFDLNSTGGTFVNSQRTSQCKLNPGDVISLAGVPLIYGQDISPSQPNNPVENTPVMPSPSRPGE